MCLIFIPPPLDDIVSVVRFKGSKRLGPGKHSRTVSMCQKIKHGRWRALAVVLVSASAFADQDIREVSGILTEMNTWILAQPKWITPLPGITFDFAGCKGVVTGEENGVGDLLPWVVERLSEANGVHLSTGKVMAGPVIDLALADIPAEFPAAVKVNDDMFERLGDQGYGLVITSEGITITARGIDGLRYGVITLAQIATDRTVLPGMAICDWPSLPWRGAQQDVSRGQAPTPKTMKRLSNVLAEGKMNVLELYIEHVYKYRAFPDIAPQEGYTQEEAGDMSAYAARRGIEIHPLLQGLGHAFQILGKPQYQHLRISPSEKMPWIMTYDIRKPEAVTMVTTMIDELCQAFPGELFNVDITEIDVEGLQADGLTPDQITDLVFGYVLQLNEAVRKHGRRLMITQGPLDSQGHLSGMGPKLDGLPKEIIIGSYYCAGGPYQPAWEKDFPRLREKGFDFFAQAWIYSHLWLTPWVNRSAEFSDLEVSRGLLHGAIGSITCDWGDAGHFHFVGEEWMPYLYHGACTWTGARLDRDYFRKAYARLLYGLETDDAVRAMEAASDVNAKGITVRDSNGAITEVATTYIWEFVHDPFTHPDITRIADPAGIGQALSDAIAPALEALSRALSAARRNRDNLEQWLFGVQCYAALGHKLLALGHHNDVAIPRERAADELMKVAEEYESLQRTFSRLWLEENRDNEGFQELVKRFAYTSVSCRKKAKEIFAF